MTNNNNLHEWILKVIETCKINDHLEGVDKLIELYYEKEKNEDDKASKEEDKHEPLEQKVDEIIARERVDETKNKNSFTPIVRASKRGSKTPKYKTETKRAA